MLIQETNKTILKNRQSHFACPAAFLINVRTWLLPTVSKGFRFGRGSSCIFCRCRMGTDRYVLSSARP